MRLTTDNTVDRVRLSRPGEARRAWAFGIEMVAEGVEDEETLELLREHGVTYAQGYHLGRPAPLS